MTRPCYVVVDREFASSISTRKLVIETAKFNVITAYSPEEALETVERFPAVDGAVIDAVVGGGGGCEEMVEKMKSIQPKLKVVVIQGPNGPGCSNADFVLDSFEPLSLLECLKKLQPGWSAKIEKRNVELEEGLR